MCKKYLYLLLVSIFFSFYSLSAAECFHKKSYPQWAYEICLENKWTMDDKGEDRAYQIILKNQTIVNTTAQQVFIEYTLLNKALNISELHLHLGPFKKTQLASKDSAFMHQKYTANLKTIQYQFDDTPIAYLASVVVKTGGHYFNFLSYGHSDKASAQAYLFKVLQNSDFKTAKEHVYQDIESIIISCQQNYHNTTKYLLLNETKPMINKESSQVEASEYVVDLVEQMTRKIFNFFELLSICSAYELLDHEFKKAHQTTMLGVQSYMGRVKHTCNEKEIYTIFSILIQNEKIYFVGVK